MKMHQVDSIGATSPIWISCLVSRKTGVAVQNLIKEVCSLPVVRWYCCSICTLCSLTLCVLCCAWYHTERGVQMLSIPTRAIGPHSHSVRRIINMSGGASSSSVKRKRDNTGNTRPDTKAPKRASEPRHILKQQHASLPAWGSSVY